MLEELEIRDTSTSGTSEPIEEEGSPPRNSERKSTTSETASLRGVHSRRRVGVKTAQIKDQVCRQSTAFSRMLTVPSNFQKQIGRIGEAILQGLWNLHRICGPVQHESGSQYPSLFAPTGSSSWPFRLSHLRGFFDGGSRRIVFHVMLPQCHMHRARSLISLYIFI